MSMTNAGDHKHRKIEPKDVTHYENSNNNNSTRCFVNLYEFYVSHCPPIDEKKKITPFYLTALKKPKGDLWYSNVPVGHNMLGTTTSGIRNMWCCWYRWLQDEPLIYCISYHDCTWINFLFHKFSEIPTVCQNKTLSE